MIAQHEAAIALLQPVRRGGLGDEPVAWRIVFAQLDRGRLRKQADQPALGAFNDLEMLGGGAVQPVGGGKQRADLIVAARRTIYVACSEISFSEMRCRRSSARI